MLVSNFKTYTPAAIFKIPLLALLLWAFSAAYHSLHLHSLTIRMPMYASMADSLNSYYYLSVFVSCLLSVLSAFLLNYIINQHNVLPRKTYLPALLYLVYSAFCGDLLVIHTGSFVNLLIIAACHELFDTYRKDSARSECFNAGMLVGLASVIFLPAAFLLLFIWAALILFRPFIWQEYLASFLGLLLPWSYTLVYFFWNNRLSAFLQGTLRNHLMNKSFHFPTGSSYGWLYLVLGVLVLLSLVRLLNGTVIPPLKSKKTLSLLFWLLLLSLCSLFMSSEINIVTLQITAVPMAVFTANLFIQLKKGWVAEVLFTILLVSILCVHWSAAMHHG